MRAEIDQETWQVHQIFEADSMPDPPWPPYANTDIVPLVIDLVGHNANAQTGDHYNQHSGKVVYKPDLSEMSWLSDLCEFVWNEETLSYDLSSILAEEDMIKEIQRINELRLEMEEM